MSTTTSTRPPATRTGGPAVLRPRLADPQELRPISRGHDADMVDDLAHLFAAPIHDDTQRERVDRALALLLGPDGADIPSLRPTGTTPDVVRQRIAARALGRLSPTNGTHRQLLTDARAILGS